MNALKCLTLIFNLKWLCLKYNVSISLSIVSKDMLFGRKIRLRRKLLHFLLVIRFKWFIYFWWSVRFALFFTLDFKLSLVIHKFYIYVLNIISNSWTSTHRWSLCRMKLDEIHHSYSKISHVAVTLVWIKKHFQTRPSRPFTQSNDNKWTTSKWPVNKQRKHNDVFQLWHNRIKPLIRLDSVFKAAFV